MDNNIDMNSLLKKAQEMVNNNQVPPELQNVVNNFNSVQNSKPNETSNLTHTDSTVQRSNDSISSSDIKKMSELLVKIKNQSSNDDISHLLYALKPYLRNQKQEKIDNYVKLIQMGKMAQFLDIFGGEKK